MADLFEDKALARRVRDAARREQRRAEERRATQDVDEDEDAIDVE
jgi:hypothetical protein